MQGRSPAAAKLWPRSTARTLYDSYEKEMNQPIIRRISDFKTPIIPPSQHFCAPSPTPVSPGLPSVGSAVLLPLRGMRDRRGSFDDAFSPMVSMPSVVDLDSGQVWPGRRCGRCVLAHVLDEVISGCKWIYKIYGYDIHGCRCTAYIYLCVDINGDK